MNMQRVWKKEKDVYWDVEEDSMMKMEFYQTSFMRNYGRTSFQVLIPRDWVSTENVVFMFVESVNFIYQDIIFSLFWLLEGLEPNFLTISGNCTLYFNVLTFPLTSNIFLPLIFSY